MQQDFVMKRVSYPNKFENINIELDHSEWLNFIALTPN